MFLNTIQISDVNINNLERASFFEQDIISCCEKLGINAPLYSIDSYVTKDINDRKQMILNSISGLDLEHAVVITTVYIRSEDIPENASDEDINNKLYELLNRDADMIESIGFTSMNFLTGYTNRVAFIYKNNLSDKIIKYAKSLVNKVS